MSRNMQSVKDVWLSVYVVCYRCSSRIGLDNAEAEICATEFAEQIFLFDDISERNALLLPENRGLLQRRATCFALNWRTRQERRYLHEIPFSHLPEAPAPRAADSQDPCMLALNCYVRDVLRQAVATLPPKQAQCAYRAWFKQESASEIAVFCETTPDAVRKNLQYAREKLPHILKQLGVHSEDFF